MTHTIYQKVSCCLNESNKGIVCSRSVELPEPTEAAPVLLAGSPASSSFFERPNSLQERAFEGLENIQRSVNSYIVILREKETLLDNMLLFGRGEIKHARYPINKSLKTNNGTSGLQANGRTIFYIKANKIIRVKKENERKRIQNTFVHVDAAQPPPPALSAFPPRCPQKNKRARKTQSPSKNVCSSSLFCRSTTLVLLRMDIP